MTDVAIISIRDNSNTLSKTKINTVDITAANVAAQLVLLTDLVTETDPMVMGALAEWRLQVVTPGTSVPPASELAQVETCWLVVYTDSQAFLDPGTDLVPNPGFGKPFTLVWPTAEYAGHLVANTDLADLAGTDMVAFVAAFEDLYVSPYGGTVTVTEIRVVGRDR